MITISQFISTVKGYFKCVIDWRRRIRSRNATDDARRAQTKRLTLQQNCTGPLFAGHPYRDSWSPHKMHRTMEE